MLLLFSCGEGTPKKTVTPVPPSKPFSPAASLAKDSIGVFRGAEFGDETATIRQMENDSFLVFQSPNLLRYEYKLPGDRRYKLDFTFKKDKLSSLNFDVFLGSEGEGERLTSDFKDLFSHRFGEHVSQMGVFVWPLPVEKPYREAYLELKDESAEFGYGKLNITAYAIR